MNPWDRQPHETVRAYAAFVAYRDAPSAERRALKSKNWFWRNAWTARVRAWDEHLDQARVAATVDAVADMARRHAMLAQQMQGISSAELAKLAAATAASEKRQTTAREAAHLGIEGAKLERLVCGEATERVDAGIDFSALSTDDLRALRALLARARAGGDAPR